MTFRASATLIILVILLAGSGIYLYREHLLPKSMLREFVEVGGFQNNWALHSISKEHEIWTVRAIIPSEFAIRFSHSHGRAFDNYILSQCPGDLDRDFWKRFPDPSFNLEVRSKGTVFGSTSVICRADLNTAKLFLEALDD